MTWRVTVTTAQGETVYREYATGRAPVVTTVSSLSDGERWLWAWQRVNPNLGDARFGLVELVSADPLERRARRIDLYVLRLS